MDERPMDPDDYSRQAHAVVLAGLPITAHHPATPEGQIEQWGLIAGRLSRARGWRRVAANVLVVALLLLMLVLGMPLVAVG